MRVDKGCVASDSRGTTVVEFALILPIFLVLVFGIFEYGFRMDQINSVRTGAAETARAASVGAWGDHSPCPSPGLPANSAAAKLVCLAKANTGLAEVHNNPDNPTEIKEEDKIRVAIVLGSGGYEVGGQVIVCMQYQLQSISGLNELVGMTDQVTFTKSPMRIDNLNAAQPLAAGQEEPLPGANWSECTP